ncbi:MAG: Methyltransferase type 11 [Candidatus Daviesbacteria bacterium GW2011_GWA2_42_7]|uniref:Methyltransferase type 11 n=3 Tax=Microgenomates group TaxID=1794810 RepID=A0A0G0UQE9_9BACT|nr:MAG: Methyltransferase type 11 [Candidatus Woesebacteria bacterium GW2011_GWB1_39_10]KKR90988.1 MAG: Methyltransferase type 11 [Candidatus Woesebacteria bacterium GW2011_GWA1_41_13b]KKS70286.1 MAG: Methyltransferase type 11 [Candidatus Daviesbacteria bacterium GW2011_GWA2_42_7]
MFGREFSNYPEVLLHSFSQMSESYGKRKKDRKNLLTILQKVYLMVFGIPEIGLQIRSLYFKDFLTSLNRDEIKTILDAGSGIGIYSFYLAKEFPTSEVFGVDLDKYNIKLSNQIKRDLKINNTKFIYGDLTKKSDQNKYDLIVNIDVLEHITDYKKVLKNFYNLLNRNGYLYIHTPQANQKRIFKSLEKWHHEDHAREGFERKKLISDLKKAGFKIVKQEETFGFFGKLAWELNHLSLRKGFIIAGLLYPILYVIGSIDLLLKNQRGLGIAILSRKD